MSVGQVQQFEATLTNKEDLNLPALFWKGIDKLLDNVGIYPHQCWWVTNDNKLHLAAIEASRPEQVLIFVGKTIVDNNPKELIFGMDRTTKEGQGTLFNDCLPVAHLKDGMWKIGVINYKPPPDKVVKFYDWDNKFWSGSVLCELSRVGLISGLDFKTVDCPDKPSEETCQLVKGYVEKIVSYGYDSDEANSYIRENSFDEQFVILANTIKNISIKETTGELDTDDIF